MGAANSSPSLEQAQSLHGFAVAAVEKVQSDAAAVCHEKGIKSFTSSLSAELFGIAELLHEIDESIDDDDLEENILAMLGDLESLCQWPTSFTLENHEDEDFSSEWYPSLRSLIAGESSSQDNIRRVGRGVAGRAFRKQLRESLEAFATLGQVVQGPSVLELMGGKMPTADPPDNHSALQNLYDMLRLHCMCDCHDEKGSTIANLRLNWSCNEEHLDKTHIPFNLLFLDHHQLAKPKTCCRWQDTQISIVAKRKRKVQFNDCDDLQANQGEIILTSTLTQDKFCNVVARGTQAQLHFLASEHGLEFQNARQSTRSFLINRESIPLQVLIASPQLTAKLKALLSFFIARSVWQFYDSDWMRSEWSKDNVHFMGEHHRPTSGVIFLNEPFLRTSLQAFAEDGDKVSKQNGEFSTHMYPKILALGVMLLEIELGKPIQEFRRPDSEELSGVNTLHLAACDVLKDETRWPPDDIFTDIKEVIRICIEPDLEKLGLSKISAGDESDKGLVRHRLHQSVVAVLEEFVRKAWDHPDKIKINPIQPQVHQASLDSRQNKEGYSTRALMNGDSTSTITNYDRVMTQIASQHVAGGIHYHFAHPVKSAAEETSEPLAE